MIEQALLGQLLPPHDRLIHAKVVGVTHDNPDGSSRQDAIGQMRQFEDVELRHNPRDEWDRNAIQVIARIAQPARRRKGDSEDLPPEIRRVQIGFLEAGLAAELAPALDRGEPWRALVTRVMLLRTHGISLLLYREAAAPAPPARPTEPACQKLSSMAPQANTAAVKALRRDLRRLVRGHASRFRTDAVAARIMRGL